MSLLTLFSLFWLSGYSIATEITGPTTVNGLERGSLTLRCAYGSQWETYLKWWCRGAVWSSCQILVKTTGSEQEVKRDRLSIRDDQKNHTFTVTMKDLRRDDADTYWCGIERTGTDLGVKVQVTIDPASTTASTATPTMPTSTTFTALVTLQETSSFPTLNSHHLDNRYKVLKLSVLLPLVFSILLLLLVAALLLVWRMMKRQKKAGMSSEQVLQSLESDLCYANLTLQQTRASPKKATTKPSSSAQADQVEVEYVTMAPLLKEDISYASLTLAAEDQEPTYCNTDQLTSPIPGRVPEESPEYTTIRRH
ncbi:CMRF35-like molecule 1 isoform X2 [Sapajus apella]|uniref:CMRF35-like molecule 1 isoform X2 n=1 Tax=Sapajus apella TaxID=9515 RepID=A0A6J3EWP1_SAPAP|nr:CMRF35-like molecule 1 isoform X2 [Sapajus apella]